MLMFQDLESVAWSGSSQMIFSLAPEYFNVILLSLQCFNLWSNNFTGINILNNKLSYFWYFLILFQKRYSWVKQSFFALERIFLLLIKSMWIMLMLFFSELDLHSEPKWEETFDSKLNFRSSIDWFYVPI